MKTFPLTPAPKSNITFVQSDPSVSFELWIISNKFFKTMVKNFGESINKTIFTAEELCISDTPWKIQTFKLTYPAFLLTSLVGWVRTVITLSSYTDSVTFLMFFTWNETCARTGDSCALTVNCTTSERELADVQTPLVPARMIDASLLVESVTVTSFEVVGTGTFVQDSEAFQNLTSWKIRTWKLNPEFPSVIFPVGRKNTGNGGNRWNLRMTLREFKIFEHRFLFCPNVITTNSKYGFIGII